MSYTIYKPNHFDTDPKSCSECGKPKSEHWMYGCSVFGEFRCPEPTTDLTNGPHILITGTYPIKRSTMVGKIEGIQ